MEPCTLKYKWKIPFNRRFSITESQNYSPDSNWSDLFKCWINVCFVLFPWALNSVEYISNMEKRVAWHFMIDDSCEWVERIVVHLPTNRIKNSNFSFQQSIKNRIHSINAYEWYESGFCSHIHIFWRQITFYLSLNGCNVQANFIAPILVFMFRLWGQVINVLFIGLSNPTQ